MNHLLHLHLNFRCVVISTISLCATHRGGGEESSADRFIIRIEPWCLRPWFGARTSFFDIADQAAKPRRFRECESIISCCVLCVLRLHGICHRTTHISCAIIAVIAVVRVVRSFSTANAATATASLKNKGEDNSYHSRHTEANVLASEKQHKRV